MGQPFIGEIRMFGGNFAPAGWKFCDGQLLLIAENDPLFQLIGTTYGGDGQDTFALPNLQSRVPFHAGTGPDGITYQLADSLGVESVTLTVNQTPVHRHPLVASTATATSQTPNNFVLAAPQAATYYNVPDALANMSPLSVGPTGGSQPHTNLQPYLCISFIISLFGIFPRQ